MYSSAEPPEVSTPNRYRLRTWRHQLAVLLSIFTGAGFWVGYINPKTWLSGAFVSFIYLIVYTTFRGFMDLSYD